MTRTRSLAAAAGVIAGVTLLARLAGFARTLVFADSVRAAGVGEVYNAVNSVPNVLYEVAAGGALAAVAVPLVAGHLGRGDTARAHQVGSALLTWAVTILMPLGALVWLLAAPIAGWLVSPRIPGGVEDGSTLLRIFAWQIPLYGIGVVLAGLLQAHRRFLGAAVAPLLSSLVVITAYAACGSIAQGRTVHVDPGALRVLGWGTTAGVAALSLPLLVPAWRTGWRWRPTWTFPDGEADRARRLAAAGLLALAAQQAAVLVTIWVAQHRGGGQGTLSVYQYIQAVYLLPYAVLAVPLATAAFPSLAGADGAVRDVTATLARTARTVLALAALGAAVLVGVSEDVGRFFLLLDVRRGDGTVSGTAVLHLAEALRLFAPGLVGFSLAALLLRALYVQGRPGSAAIAVAGGWAVAALGPLLQLGDRASAGETLGALGLWSSVGLTLAALALVFLVWDAWGDGALVGVSRAAGAALLAAVLAALVTHWVAGPGRLDGLPPSLLAVVTGGLWRGALTVVLYVVALRVLDRRTVALLDLRRLRGRS